MRLPERDRPMPSTEAFYGGLPIGWTERRLRFLCQIIPSNVDKHSRDDELPVELCNYTDVYYNDLITRGIQFMEATATPEQLARFELQGGDTVITKDSETADDIGIPAFVPEALPGVVCGYHLTILRPGSDVEGRFIHWLFQAAPVRSRLETLATGLTRVGLSQQALKDLVVPLPSLDEQRRIAAFLEHETARIDELVREHNYLIQYLSEKRQSIVLQAITQGVEDPPSITSSGVDWLGCVPSHWRVTRLRHLTTHIEQGWSPEAENRPPTLDEWGVLKLSAVSNGRFHESEAKALPAGLTPRANLEVRRGDLLITRANTPLLVGGVCVVEASRPRLMLSDLIYRVRLNRNVLDGEFLAYFLSHPLGRIQIESDARGTSASMVKISQEHIRNWLIPVPPIEEQRRIVDHLDRETRRIDLLMLEAEQAIALAHERRSALISATVTGQLDLRDWHRPETEAVAEVA